MWKISSKMCSHISISKFIVKPFLLSTTDPFSCAIQVAFVITTHISLGLVAPFWWPQTDTFCNTKIKAWLSCENGCLLWRIVPQHGSFLWHSIISIVKCMLWLWSLPPSSGTVLEYVWHVFVPTSNHVSGIFICVYIYILLYMESIKEIPVFASFNYDLKVCLSIHSSTKDWIVEFNMPNECWMRNCILSYLFQLARN